MGDLTGIRDFGEAIPEWVSEQGVFCGQAVLSDELEFEIVNFVESSLSKKILIIRVIISTIKQI